LLYLLIAEINDMERYNQAYQSKLKYEKIRNSFPLTGIRKKSNNENRLSETTMNFDINNSIFNSSYYSDDSDNDGDKVIIWNKDNDKIHTLDHSYINEFRTNFMNTLNKKNLINKIKCKQYISNEKETTNNVSTQTMLTKSSSSSSLSSSSSINNNNNNKNNKRLFNKISKVTKFEYINDVSDEESSDLGPIETINDILKRNNKSTDANCIFPLIWPELSEIGWFITRQKSQDKLTKAKICLLSNNEIFIPPWTALIDKENIRKYGLIIDDLICNSDYFIKKELLIEYIKKYGCTNKTTEPNILTSSSSLPQSIVKAKRHSITPNKFIAFYI
jgi:hypothetical protein